MRATEEVREMEAEMNETWNKKIRRGKETVAYGVGGCLKNVLN